MWSLAQNFLFLGICCSVLIGHCQGVLPASIRVAAIFDDNQDSKHELAFKYGVERVNRDPLILPGKRLQAEIIKVPAGNR